MSVLYYRNKSIAARDCIDIVALIPNARRSNSLHVYVASEELVEEANEQNVRQTIAMSAMRRSLSKESIQTLLHSQGPRDRVLHVAPSLAFECYMWRHL